MSDAQDELDFASRLQRLDAERDQVVAERRELAKTLRQRGHSYAAIGEMLGVSHVTAMHDVGEKDTPEQWMRRKAGAPEYAGGGGDPLDPGNELGLGDTPHPATPSADDWMRSRIDHQTDMPVFTSD